ncbi:histidine acid phosphatase, partial [Ancylostoma caninum]
LVQSKSNVEVERVAEAWQAPLEANTTTLVYVQVAWRHGDRTPAAPVPFSDADSWSEGLGELTKKGIAQQYRLGKWLRARYGKFLGDHFDRHEVFVRSSDYNRTLMSAQANMAGLFPPSKSEMWETGFAWQPVPVHSYPKSIDKELYEDIACPTASAEFRKVWKSGVVSKMELENRDLILFLREHSQIPNFQFYMLWMIYDNLFCMLQHNDTHVWPPWMNSSLFSRVQKLYDASSRMKYHTEVLRRLRGGPLLKDIVDRFVAKGHGALGDRPKLYAYSAFFACPHNVPLFDSLLSLNFDRCPSFD